MSRTSDLSKPLEDDPQRKRRVGGRAKEADENDRRILEAAQQIFVADPTAPIAAVAEKAGVGIAALYRRYPGKEHLLATLCAIGQRVYIAEAEAALADERSPWEAYTQFLRRIVVQNTHLLSSRLAGTFRPTDVHVELGQRLQARSEELFQRAQASGAMRKDVTLLDVGFLLEGLAQVELGDAQRTAELRLRLVSLLIDALRVEATTPLPGTPPTWEEQEARWNAPPG